MSKAAQNIAASWLARRALKYPRARTDGRSIWYRDNMILSTSDDENEVLFCLQGWPTRTTYEYLRVPLCSFTNSPWLSLSKGVMTIGLEDWGEIQIDPHRWHGWFRKRGEIVIYDNPPYEWLEGGAGQYVPKASRVLADPLQSGFAIYD